MPTLIDDTIAAIATPIGKSGIGVIRLSGRDSRKIVETVSYPHKALQDHTTSLRRIKNVKTGKTVDQAMVTYFQAPRSFTTEDVVEIGCHGSPPVLKAVLGVLLEAGARMATPGEFTLRAFLRGRIDLPQAEGIRDLIEAKTLFQAQVARQQAEGALSRRLSPIKQSLVQLVARLEAGIDFADDDVSVMPDEAIEKRLRSLLADLAGLDGSYALGRLVSEGMSVAIVGRANVGKSTLFNAVLKQQRSIVAESPGTTRDVIAETTDLGGIPVRWLDTAGIRSSVEPVERIGIDKTREVMADADKVLLVLDGSVDLTEEDRNLLDAVRQRPCCLVINKIDLPQRVRLEGVGRRDAQSVRVSALTGEGVNALKDVLFGELDGQQAVEQERVFITSLRQKQLIGESLQALRRAADVLQQGLPHEVILLDLHGALRSLNSLTGETTIEDILGNIFSTFCIGK